MRVGKRSFNLRPERPDQRSAVVSDPVAYGCCLATAADVKVVPGFVMGTGNVHAAERTHGHCDDGG
jgi:hypothetical protein